VPDDNPDVRRLNIIELGIKASRAHLREKDDKLALVLLQLRAEIEQQCKGIDDYREPEALTEVWMIPLASFLFGVPDHKDAITSFVVGLNGIKQREFLEIGVTALLRRGHDMQAATLAKTLLDAASHVHVAMPQEPICLAVWHLA
jgi:hypothetical protein